MRIDRRTITYSSVVVVMALFLSAALLQLTQTTAKSAALARPLAQIDGPTLTITKTVEGDVPGSPWEFVVEGISASGVLSTVTVPSNGAITIPLPVGLYAVTEITKTGYWLRSSGCPFPFQRVDTAAATNGSPFNPAIVFIEGDAACEFINTKVSIELTKTVGTEAGVCATTDEIDVFTGTEVHYCYEVQNTGALTLTHHWLEDSPLGSIFGNLAYTLAPGASIDTVTAGLTVSDVLNVTTMNVATWTAEMTSSYVFDAVNSLIQSADPIETIDFVNGLITVTTEAVDSALVNVFEPSKIIIDKVTSPVGSSQVFTFAFGPQAGPAVEVLLSDQDTPYESGDLFPGVYAVSELVPEGWALVGAVCTNDAGASYPADAIDLPAGITVTCVFTNEQLGRVIVDKVTDPAGSTQSFGFTLTTTEGDVPFSLTDGAAPFDSGYVPPASYTVVETPVTGWTQVSAVCDDGSPLDDINLLPGLTVTCTFTNRQDPTALDQEDLPGLKLYLPQIGTDQ